MAADKTKKVPVRFLRTHFEGSESGVGAAKPFVIGQEVDLPEDQAKGLASYGIVELLIAEEGKKAVARLGTKEVVTRIEQLMPLADEKNADAIAELEKIRDDEIAGGKPRKTVLGALRSAQVEGLPDAED
jgi:hypothetical protein